MDAVPTLVSWGQTKQGPSQRWLERHGGEGGAPGEGGTGEAPSGAFFHLHEQQRSGSGQDCYANGIVF